MPNALPPSDESDGDERIVFFGGPPGTKFEGTWSDGTPIKAVHVPNEEIVLGPNPLVIRLPPPKRSRRDRIRTRSMKLARRLKGRHA